MAKVIPPAKKHSRIPKEVKGLILLGFSLILFLAFLSFDREHADKNWLGLAGWGLGVAFNFLLGLCSYMLPVFFGWIGWQYLLGRDIPSLTAKSIWFGILVISCCLLLNLIAELGLISASLFENKIYSETHLFELPYPHRRVRYNLGGVPFYYLYTDLPTLNLQRMLSDVGIALTFTITGLVSFLLLTNIRLISLIQLVKMKASKAQQDAPSQDKEKEVPTVETSSHEEIEKTLLRHLPGPIYAPGKSKERELTIRTLHDGSEPEKKNASEGKPPPSSRRQAAIDAQKIVNGDFTTYQLPPPSLLKNAKKVDQPSLKKDLKRQAEILEETLLSFGIEAKVGEINCGPTITSFEVHPAIGVKVQKIKTLENDIALNLQAKSIRIIAPIPGKAAVGVEVPSLYPQEVSFKELLLQYQQNPRKMMIPLLLGKTVSGDNVISELARMPHCLIAGATGSGKSVCINTLIMSILMNARPDEIKLLMVDPKKVELTPYTNLPHMIAPVITEAPGAYAALSWLVKEMQTRYDILKQLGVRNITAFNSRQINKELEASLSIPVPVKMHAIVAIIDEFADLMMASSSDLETPIARIAQMARAVGIHLILATQRPSREVITGLIKANFPTRIAFKVSSRINSQIILDDVGAENLLGNGDMLFLPPGSSTLIRSQGAYISDEEINKVVSFICDQSPPHYLIESFDRMGFQESSSGDPSDESPRDTLYEQAESLVIETGTASTTYLQRKLKIGYARAASLMDELETKGIISAQEGAKPRRILNAKNSSSSKPGNSYDEQESFE